MRRILSLLLLVAVLFGVDVQAQTKVLEGDFLQGGAQAERNYIKNSEIEKNITGYVRFADGASLANGAGSVSPTASIAFGNTAPLSGSGNLVYTPGAAANQGWSVDFKIDRKHLASMLTVQFDYELGTYSNYTCGPLATDTCDLKVAVYDKDSGAFVQIVEGERIQKVSGPFTHKAKFQAHVTDVNYRLIVYQTTTTTTWTNAKFDSIKVGPQATPRGPPVSDWVSYTPTLTPTNPNIALQYGKYRRVGDSVEIAVGYAWTAAGATGGINISLPSGMIADFNKIGSGATVGPGFFYTGSTGFKSATARLAVTSTFYFPVDGTGNDLQGSNGAAGAALFFTARVPISGWSSNVQFSSDDNARPVAARLVLPSAQTIATPANTLTKLNFTLANFDTTNSLVAGSNAWYAPVSAKYRIYLQVRFTALEPGATTYCQLFIYKKGVQVATQYLYYATGSSGSDPMVSVMDVEDIAAGDPLEFYVKSNDTSYGVGNDGSTTFATIERLAPSGTIAASDNVAIKYTSSATQQIASSTNVTIAYANKVYASHENAWDGTKFTAPVAGLYFVSAATANATLAGPYGGNYIVIAKGAPGSGTVVSGANFPSQVATSLTVSCTVSALVPLLAGETIYIYRVQDSGSNKNLNGDPNLNYISINKVGTY